MRLELTTSAVTGRRSNQLSHWAIFIGRSLALPYMAALSSN